MKISDLINKLEEFKKSNGDISICFGEAGSGLGSRPFMEMMDDKIVRVQDIHMVKEDDRIKLSTNDFLINDNNDNFIGKEPGIVHKMVILAYPYCKKDCSPN